MLLKSNNKLTKSKQTIKLWTFLTISKIIHSQNYVGKINEKLYINKLKFYKKKKKKIQ